MTKLTCKINNVNDITSLQEIVNNNTTNISTLQSYTVLNGTNFGVGPGALSNLTTGTQNTIVGNWEDALPYMITQEVVIHVLVILWEKAVNKLLIIPLLGLMPNFSQAKHFSVGPLH